MDKNHLLLLLAIEVNKANILAKYIYERKKSKVNKRIAVRPLLKERKAKGYFHSLVSEMRLNDVESYINFHRMDPATFDELLHILGPSLKNMPVREQEYITPAERLSLTLRYLASCDSMKSIGYYGFRIGASTTSNIIRETTDLIWQKLQFVFPKPSTTMWENISLSFYSRWGFPNCLGAIDGKHVIIQAFPHHNSLTFNYKHSHSIVLMAVADADYKFILVDIGALGHNSDGGVFRNSRFGKTILENNGDLELPPPKNLPGTNVVTPYAFVADEAFPLRSNILRPYPGRSTGNLPPKQDYFNRRLSRARRVVENSFGILASRFRVYRKPIIASKETAINIVKATVCLHNFLRDRASSQYINGELIDREGHDGVVVPGQWREEDHQGMRSIGRTGSNRASNSAVAIRNTYADFFTQFLQMQ